MKRVACVGILVADVMAPVGAMPARGELARVDSVTVHNGGNAMTAAINLHKMGVESYMVGKVGDDLFGKFLSDCLDKEGVDISGLKRDSDTQSSVSLVLLDSSGERSFLHCVGTNATFSYSDIDFSVIEKCDLVFVTGSFLMDKFDGDETAAFLKKCKEMGKTTFLDVCFDARGLWDKLIDSSLPYLDFFMPSIDEAREIARCGDDPDDIADVFMKKGAKNVVIKLGSRGSFLKLSGWERGRVYPSLKGIVAVDTTGAGDSFCSGFLAAYARGYTPEECMAVANTTGALSVTAKGATTGIRDFDKTIEFMEEHKC